MSRFNLVPHPTFSPTRCVTCQGNKDAGGFIDLMADSEAVNGYTEAGDPIAGKPGVEPTFGHLWLCASCGRQVAALLGWTSPVEAAVLNGRIEMLEASYCELADELEAEKSPESKVVKVADLQRYLRTPAEPLGVANSLNG